MSKTLYEHNYLFCTNCKKITEYYEVCSHTLKKRIIYGILTLGLSEAFVFYYYKCKMCDSRIEVTYK